MAFPAFGGEHVSIESSIAAQSSSLTATLVVSSPTEDAISVRSSDSRASRRSAASAATLHRVAVETRLEQRRIVAEQAAVQAAAAAAALVEFDEEDERAYQAALAEAEAHAMCDGSGVSNDSSSGEENAMVNPDGFAEYDEERPADHPDTYTTSPSTFQMDGDDTDEDDDEAMARQTAANEYLQEYSDFVPAFEVE
eukprot:15163923-Heterocapsa_arctica.AAC.1